MGPTRTLEFVLYDAKRQAYTGDHAKRVVMTARSPSPVSSPAPKAAVKRVAPTRVSISASAAAPSAQTQDNISDEASGSSSMLPPSPKGTSATSVSAGSANATVNGTAATTPSRKGKEREVNTPGTTPVANGHANRHANGVNGTPNGTPKSNAAATPKTTPKTASAAMPKKGELDMTWPEPFASAKRAAGLYNGSMACYTNATLQVLLHTPPLLRVAVGHNPGDCLLAARSKFCMLCAIRKIATTEHFAGQKRAYRPLAVHNNLGQIKKGFSKNRQEDAHEFFRFVTDAFQNTELAGKPKDYPEKEKLKAWVYKMWGGRLRSRVLCLTCRKPSDTFDSVLDLSLDVPARSKTIDDLFKGLVHEDRLDGDNKYNCENCKKKSAATKAMRIAEAPPVLTLHLKRFGFSFQNPGRMTKVNNLIDYPQTLDIAPYMTEGRHDGTQYRLFAVTCHHGTSLHYGHYTSYVLGPSGSWYSADDEDVSPVKLSTVLHDRSAYLLSYMRVPRGEKLPNGTPSAASRADATAASSSTEVSPAGPAAKRRRGEESVQSSPNKKNGRPPLAAAYGSNKANGDSPALARLVNQYASDDSDEDALPAPHAIRGDAFASPISRPSHPSPGAALKGKHHRVNHKHGIAGHGGGKHGGGGGKQGKRGAPMPFAAGSLKSNMRGNGGGGGGRKKGMKKAMRGRNH